MREWIYPKNSLMQHILQCSLWFLALFSLTTHVPKDSTQLLCVCIQTSELGKFIIPRVLFIYVWRCRVLWNSSLSLTAKKQVWAYMTFQKKAAGQNGTPLSLSEIRPPCLFTSHFILVKLWTIWSCLEDKLNCASLVSSSPLSPSPSCNNILKSQSLKWL